MVNPLGARLKTGTIDTACEFVVDGCELVESAECHGHTSALRRSRSVPLVSSHVARSESVTGLTGDTTGPAWVSRPVESHHRPTHPSFWQFEASPYRAAPKDLTFISRIA